MAEYGMAGGLVQSAHFAVWLSKDKFAAFVGRLYQTPPPKFLTLPFKANY
jgi:hypothetical protein